MLCTYMLYFFFFFKQKTAYEMRISDWSSDVCSSDLIVQRVIHIRMFGLQPIDDVASQSAVSGSHLDDIEAIRAPHSLIHFGKGVADRMTKRRGDRKSVV